MQDFTITFSCKEDADGQHIHIDTEPDMPLVTACTVLEGVMDEMRRQAPEDGKTALENGYEIRPLHDADGHLPESPQPAYVVYRYGKAMALLTADQLAEYGEYPFRREDVKLAVVGE